MSLVEPTTGPPRAEAYVRQPPPPPDWYDNPTGPGLRYWDGEKWTDSYSQPIQPAALPSHGWSGVVIFFGYVAAVLAPIVGLILGIIAANKADSGTKSHGVAMIVISVIAFLIYAGAFYSAG